MGVLAALAALYIENCVWWNGRDAPRHEHYVKSVPYPGTDEKQLRKYLEN